MKRLLLVAAVAALTAGCATVKPWERDQLSLEPMQIEDGSAQRFERNIETYREGAIGASGGKSGGGCGCS